MDHEFIKCLDDIYHFYIENKEEGDIDNVLISCWLALHEAPFPKLDKIYVAKSNIEGMGVFSKKPIKKGEIVSMYPSEMVILDQKYPIGTERLQKYMNNNYIYNNVYTYKVDDRYSILGDSHFISDTNMVGHILNDACSSDGTQEGNKNYKTDKQNCIYYQYKNMFILIVACKDIDINEELLVAYQVDYWKMISHNNKIQTNKLFT